MLKINLFKKKGCMHLWFFFNIFLLLTGKTKILAWNMLWKYWIYYILNYIT